MTQLYQSAKTWLLALVIGVVSLGTQAQTAPVIRTFTVQQVTELAPGTELVFKLNGTPAGTATVALDGSTNVVTLSETSVGNYTGAYTLSIRDQLKFNSGVRATLRVGDKDVQATLGQTLLTASAHQAAVNAATPTPVIDYFGTQHSNLSGGYDIAYTVRGTPGAQAVLTLDGTDTRLALTETRAGEYTGRYTIRTRDRIGANSVATTTLTLGNKSVRVSKALSAAPVQPTLAARQSCDTCGLVQSVEVVEVQGEPGYVGAIAGGVAGAVLGNQVGKGDGRTAARILGAVGGAYAGREIEKQVIKDKRYNVTVRLHNGVVQTVQHAEDPGLRNGQQVKIVEGRVVAND